MALENIRQFGKKLDAMKNPRKRRAFIDSLHARIVQGDIYNLDAASIREVARIEKKYGFKSHADKLLNHEQYKNTLEESKPYFFLVTEDYTIGTPRGMSASDRTIDVHFKDLAENYDLQEKLYLASAVLLKPEFNPPLAYPMEGKKLMECAATYLAAFTNNPTEQSDRREYLTNNGLVRILITNPTLLQEVKQVA